MTGEWTPDYFTFPWVPRLLARAAPDARLLLLLRDPVERFRSGLAHLDRMGTPVDGTAMADAVQRGYYRAALEVWLEHFDADQLLVLQHERLRARTGRCSWHVTFAHLGLAPTDATSGAPAFARSLDRAAPAGRARQELGDEVVDFLVQLYEPDVVALARARRRSRRRSLAELRLSGRPRPRAPDRTHQPRAGNGGSRPAARRAPSHSPWAMAVRSARERAFCRCRAE